MNQQQKIEKEWNEICKKEKEISSEMATKKQKMMDDILKEMSEKDEEITKLRKEIKALNMKMSKMEADLKAVIINFIKIFDHIYLLFHYFSIIYQFIIVPCRPNC